MASSVMPAFNAIEPINSEHVLMGTCFVMGIDILDGLMRLRGVLVNGPINILAIACAVRNQD